MWTAGRMNLNPGAVADAVLFEELILHMSAELDRRHKPPESGGGGGGSSG
eukprot:SAG11_NODE_17249_length_524_cov_0.727059_1_plen_49_part_10